MTRDEVMAEIKSKQAERDRMPAHWVERRDVLNGGIDELIDVWLEAE